MTLIRTGCILAPEQITQKKSFRRLSSHPNEIYAHDFGSLKCKHTIYVWRNGKAGGCLAALFSKYVYVCALGARVFYRVRRRHSRDGLLPTGRREGAVNTKEAGNPTSEMLNPITARLNLYKDDVYPFGGRH